MLTTLQPPMLQEEPPIIARYLLVGEPIVRPPPSSPSPVAPVGGPSGVRRSHHPEKEPQDSETNPPDDMLCEQCGEVNARKQRLQMMESVIWRQRWVEVRSHCVTLKAHCGEAPIAIHPLTAQAGLVDEGGRLFSLTLVQESVRMPNAATTDTVDPAALSGAGLAEEATTVKNPTAPSTTAGSTSVTTTVAVAAVIQQQQHPTSQQQQTSVPSSHGGDASTTTKHLNQRNDRALSVLTAAVVPPSAVAVSPLVLPPAMRCSSNNSNSNHDDKLEEQQQQQQQQQRRRQPTPADRTPPPSPPSVFSAEYNGSSYDDDEQDRAGGGDDDELYEEYDEEDVESSGYGEEEEGEDHEEEEEGESELESDTDVLLNTIHSITAFRMEGGKEEFSANSHTSTTTTAATSSSSSSSVISFELIGPLTPNNAPVLLRQGQRSPSGRHQHQQQPTTTTRGKSEDIIAIATTTTNISSSNNTTTTTATTTMMVGATTATATATEIPPVLLHYFLPFRCCDRTECLDMLANFGAIVRQLQFQEKTTQVAPEDLGFAPLMTSAEWDAMRNEHRRVLDELRAWQRRAFDAETKQKEADARLMEERVQRRALDVVVDDLRATIRRLTQDLRVLQAQLDRHAAQDAKRVSLTRAAFRAFEQYHAHHQSHLLDWTRHHLCSQEIAKFALALKRASQILQPIKGAEQFAKEFGHHWPIVEKLIELPVVVLAEDQALTVAKQELQHWLDELCGGTGWRWPRGASAEQAPVIAPLPLKVTAAAGSPKNNKNNSKNSNSSSNPLINGTTASVEAQQQQQPSSTEEAPPPGGTTTTTATATAAAALLSSRYSPFSKNPSQQFSSPTMMMKSPLKVQQKQIQPQKQQTSATFSSPPSSFSKSPRRDPSGPARAVLTADEAVQMLGLLHQRSPSPQPTTATTTADRTAPRRDMSSPAVSSPPHLTCYRTGRSSSSSFSPRPNPHHHHHRDQEQEQQQRWKLGSGAPFLASPEVTKGLRRATSTSTAVRAGSLWALKSQAQECTRSLSSMPSHPHGRSSSKSPSTTLKEASVMVVVSHG